MSQAAEQERLDQVNAAMRAAFFEQLGPRPASTPPSAKPKVLFVRADVASLLGNDHRALLTKFRRAAKIAASSAHVAWDATAVFFRRAGEAPCWRIVLG